MELSDNTEIILLTHQGIIVLVSPAIRSLISITLLFHLSLNVCARMCFGIAVGSGIIGGLNKQGVKTFLEMMKGG